MAKLFPDEFIEQVRNIDIVEVAETYFDLKQMGGILQTACIHKGDNDPSLTFFPKTNTFYCFGCGAGKKPKTEGSEVISFVMWVDNCTFTEAVVKLAGMKGWEVPKKGLSPEDKKKQELYARAIVENRAYWEHLQKEERALVYLKERGIGPEEINKWRIGYIPKEHASYHKETVVFALMNDWGQTVGFSHRNMQKEFYGEKPNAPKYVNSSKSPIFDKGSILYGLNFVKKKIREAGYVIVGEGFGDTILAQKLDLPFVSIMGTSLTDQHIRLLKQYTQEIVLWMDGDNGGKTATTRHAQALRKEGFLVKVINYEGKDPDDVFFSILQEVEAGEYTWEEAAALTKQLVEEQAVLASQYEIESILSRYESRLTELQIQTVREIAPMLSQIEGETEQAFTKRMAAKRLGVTASELGWE